MDGTSEFGGQRGVALLLVLTAVVILAAAVTEFSYTTRINLAVTSHAQKEVQAYFAARSGIMIALFVLEAKEVVDRIVGTFASAAGGMNTQNIEIWRAIEPLCSGLSSSRFNLYGIDLMDMEGLEGMGMPEGQEFKCGVELEDGKININGVASIADKQTLHGALRGIFMQHFTSDLFNENENKVDEVIAAIIDWADPDDNKTQVEQGVVIESQGGMGEGGGQYSKFGYKVKNAKYDSIEELNYVDGITDGVFCLLKDKITVYNTEKLNINSADIETIKGLVCSHLLDKGMILCNPQVRAQGLPAPIDIIGEYLEVCREAKNRLFTPPFSSAQSFVQFFHRLGVFVQQDIPLDGASLSQKVGTKGRIWRVEAEGKSGKVVRRIQVVLDTSTGKIVYWRE